MDIANLLKAVRYLQDTIFNQQKYIAELERKIFDLELQYSKKKTTKGKAKCAIINFDIHDILNRKTL